MGKQGPAAGVPREIEGLVRSGSLTGLTEEELLARFVQRRDPRALEAIVGLHGPMVLAVCRQLLSDSNDVEDSFQATFLVLIRKAGSIRRPGSLGSWLYGVAYRTARRLRRTPQPLRLVVEPAGETSPCPIDQIEEREALHQEISRLPEKYRQPIVLCYLEGLTHDAAAARLSWPVGTVRGRLARARDRLRKQLTSRGVCLSAGFLDSREWAGIRGLPLAVARTQTIVRLLKPCASSRVVSLAQGALAVMFTEKLKWIAISVVTPSLVLIAAGTALIAGSKPGTQGNAPVLIVQAKAGESQKTVEKKAVQHDKAEAELEAKANSLDSDKVEAELLEMETRALQNTLQQLIQQSVEPPGFGGMLGGGPPGAANARLRDQMEQYQADQRRKVVELRQTYVKKKLSLATLKRQIARGSKELGQPDSETPSLAEMSQRLRALESKVDRILDAVTQNPR